MIEFIRPQAFWLLGLVPLWLVWSWRQPVTLQLAPLMLRHSALPPAAQMSAARSRLPLLLRAMAAALLCVALAQPRQAVGWIQPPPIGRDIALVLDVSASMSQNDFAIDGKTVTRMEMVKRVLREFIAGREGDRFSVMVFGTGAAVLAPPTSDKQLVLLQLDRVQAGALGDYTASGDALGLALRSVRAERLRPALIFIGDGDPANAGQMQPAEALAIAAALRIPVHTMQIGDGPAYDAGEAASKDHQEPQPSFADIARLSGGRHAVVRNSEDARKFLALVDAMEPTMRPAPTAREMREWYALPLAFALLLLALARIAEARPGRRRAMALEEPA